MLANSYSSPPPVLAPRRSLLGLSFPEAQALLATFAKPLDDWDGSDGA